MLKDGSYVRMIIAPETRLGTLYAEVGPHGTPRLLFRLDPRLNEKLDDFIIDEADFEECERPSDEEIASTNRILEIEDSLPKS